MTTKQNANKSMEKIQTASNCFHMKHNIEFSMCMKQIKSRWIRCNRW